MKNLKKLVVIILALSLTMCFVGCIKMDVGVTINEDGTAAMTAKMSISEELYDMMYSGLGGEEETSTDDEAPGKEDFVEEIIDGEKYYSYSATIEYNTYDELIVALKELEAYDGMPVFEKIDIYSRDEGVYIIDMKTAVMDTGSLGTEEMTVPADWFTLTMTVKMPGDIEKVVGGEMLEDGTVKFSLNDFTESRTLSVQSKVSHFNMTRSIIIWVVGLSIIAFVTITHFRQKKTADIDKDEEPEEIAEN